MDPPRPSELSPQRPRRRHGELQHPLRPQRSWGLSGPCWSVLHMVPRPTCRRGGLEDRLTQKGVIALGPLPRPCMGVGARWMAWR